MMFSWIVLTTEHVSDKVIWSLNPGEIVLMVVGGILTLALIGLFIFILRTAFKEENAMKKKP